MKKGFLGKYIIGSAFIWAFVILLVSFGLFDFVYKTNVIITFGLGALLHTVLVWGLLAAEVKKGTDE